MRKCYWVFGLGSFVVTLALFLTLLFPLWDKRFDVFSIYNSGGAEGFGLGNPVFNNTDNLGWEFLDNNTVIHAWNKNDDYYFNAINGVQFSNHYNEYWTRNVLMLGYYDGDEWVLVYRVDELSGFNRVFEGVTDVFMNLTLWKDLSYKGYSFRVAVRYHLGVNDSNLTIIPYIKNIGSVDIPYVLGFGWELKDIKIDNNYENDWIRVNETSYPLNQTLNVKYTNITKTVYGFNETTNTSYNYTVKDGAFYLENITSGSTSNKFLYLKWNPELDYLVWVKSRANQYNAPVTLFIRIGTLSAGQEKYTKLHWLDADSDYVYAGGGTYKVWKLLKSDLSKVAESVNYGDIIFALAGDDDYVYCAGGTYKVWKLLKSDLSKVAESISYGNAIFALAVDDDYVYCGGATTHKVWKLLKSDLSKVAESDSYGSTIYALAVDDDYVYCGGAGDDAWTVWKLLKSDLSKVAESDSYGDAILALAVDDDYVYCAGDAWTVWKLLKSDLSKVVESDSFDEAILALAVDDDYVYCGGYIDKKVWKLLKSDLSISAESDGYGDIYALAVDDDYVYCGGANIKKVWKLLKSDLSMVAESDSYGSTIYALHTLSIVGENRVNTQVFSYWFSCGNESYSCLLYTSDAADE